MPPPTDVSARIRKVLREALSLDLDERHFSETSKLDDLVGLDSLALLEFVAGLEEEFRITIEPDRLELNTLRDLPKLAAYITERTAAGAS